MIAYEFGYWGIGFVCRKSKSTVFFRAACWGVLSGAATFFLVWLVRSHIAIEKVFPDLAILWGGWTFTQTFLLAFRTNIAYGRYIEGLGLLQKIQGVWINAASNLIAFSSLDVSKSPEAVKTVLGFQHLVVRLMSLMYCTALQEIAVMEDEDFDIISISELGRDSLAHYLQSTHRLEIVMQWMQQLICDHHKNGSIWIAPPVLSRVFQELSNGIVLVHDAMKITEYPFPHPYAQMLTILLLAYSCIFPFVLAATMHDPFSTSLLCFLVVFSHWTMNYIAAEIEMPFGDDPNDLEIREMCKHFNNKLITLMNPLSMRAPDFEYNTQHDGLQEMRFTALINLASMIDPTQTTNSEATRPSMTSAYSLPTTTNDSKRLQVRRARRRAKGMRATALQQAIRAVEGSIRSQGTNSQETHSHGTGSQGSSGNRWSSLSIFQSRAVVTQDGCRNSPDFVCAAGSSPSSRESPCNSQMIRGSSPQPVEPYDALQFMHAASPQGYDQYENAAMREVDETVFQLDPEEGDAIINNTKF